MEVAFRFRGLYKDVDPNKVFEVLDRLVDQNGGAITPDDVLAEAEKSNSPLHRCFEWDNKKAAQFARKKQVSTLKNQLVQVRDGKPTRIPVFAYVHPEGRERGARMLMRRTAVDRMPKLREQMVGQGLRQFTNLYNTYRGYRELEPLLAPLRRALEKLRAKAGADA